MRNKSSQHEQIVRLRTHRRTITETDIVTFVNLAGLHEPPFIDMEFVRNEMEPGHQRRFAPAPLVISFAIGLVATYMMGVLERVTEGEPHGKLAGLVGLDARVKAAVFPGDTIHVDLEAQVDRRTSGGHLIVALRHIVVNQNDVVVADFTERALYLPPNDG